MCFCFPCQLGRGNHPYNKSSTRLPWYSVWWACSFKQSWWKEGRWSSKRRTGTKHLNTFLGTCSSPTLLQEWSPRSPDLSVLDFHVFGVMKEEVFSHPRPENLQQLEEKIRASFTNLCPDSLRRAFQSVRTRAERCVAAGGWYFES